MLSFIKLSIIYVEGRNKANYIECPQAVCHSAECRGALTREPSITRIYCTRVSLSYILSDLVTAVNYSSNFI
jgi:hypothetical protein